MSLATRFAIVAASGTLALTAGIGSLPAQADTVPASSPQGSAALTPVAVSMGDSFISGEGGFAAA